MAGVRRGLHVQEAADACLDELKLTHNRRLNMSTKITRKLSRRKCASVTLRAESLENRQLMAADLEFCNPLVEFSADHATAFLDSVKQVGVLGDDDHGNTIETATHLSESLSGGGQIESVYDVDFFTFDVTAGTEYWIETELSTLADSTLRLINSQGTMLAFDDDSGLGLASRLQWHALESGPVFVEVAGYGTATGAYELRVSLGNDDHGDSPATATRTSEGTNNTGQIETAYDTDVFTFDAIAGAGYRLETSLGTLHDSTLRLIDSDGVSELAFDDDSGFGFASSIRWRAINSGPVFVEVAGYGSAVGDYTLRITKERLRGDFDDDGSYTTSDINVLVAGIVSGQGDANFDLTHDGAVNEADLTAWLQIAGRIRPGDANLDGQVNARDLNAVGAHWYTENAGWSGGDFNADGIVNAADLNLLSQNFGVSTSPSNSLYVNFDGVVLSADEMARYASNLDPEYDGVIVEPLFRNVSHRETIIAGILTNVQADLAPFGITVERYYGATVEGTGETTIFVGPSTMFHPHIASSIDFGNNNLTDIAFVGEENWGGDVDDIVLALSDVVLHEAGHTYGLYHVNAVRDGVLHPETMGLRYSSDQSEWIRDTAFLDQAFEEYGNHGSGHGLQNTHQTMLNTFTRSDERQTNVSVSALDHLLPVYQAPGRSDRLRKQVDTLSSQYTEFRVEAIRYEPAIPNLA